MPDVHIITGENIPKRLYGSDGGYALRPTSREELISLEDRFFLQNQETKIELDATSVVLPDTRVSAANMEEYATLAEFALLLLVVSGHPSFVAIGVFSSNVCSHAWLLEHSANQLIVPQFARRMNGRATSQWIKRCSMARLNLKDRMHITASRYVRYARADNRLDALTDLCISLESLLDSQTEISFRFSCCLAKVTGSKGQKAEDSAKLLSQLYELRSKIVHGDPAAVKLMKKMEPNIPLLHTLARTILTSYVLFTSEHSRDEWKSHLKSCLFT